MDESSITAEIHKLIDSKIERGDTVLVHWVAQEILAAHDSIDGDDAAWYRVCTFKEVCRVAKSAIGKYKSDATTADQLVLPGFKHLCRAYPLNRNEELVLVPVDQCTEAELANRAAELEKMAKGCREHAREIREYVLSRSEAAAA